jgi:hypothetical protein
MPLAELEPAIFGSENQRLIFAQQAAGRSFGPTGQPDMSALER